MDVTLPDLGESIREAEVLKVLVGEGDAVAADQPLLELETDKATFELPSPQAGTVSRVHVKKGDTVRVGQKVLTIEAGRAASDRREPKKAAGRAGASTGPASCRRRSGVRTAGGGRATRARR